MEDKIEVSREDLRYIVQEVVAETLLSLGIDTDHPMETQRDFQHARTLRIATESVQKKGLIIIIGVLASGMAAIIWVGLKESLTH